MQVKGYKVFTQLLGGLLFITGILGIAQTWPPGDLEAWLLMILGVVAMQVGKAPKR